MNLDVLRRLPWLLMGFCCLANGADGISDAGSAAGKRQVRVLAILPTEDEPLRIALVTDGEYARQVLVGGLIMALINGAVQKSRNAPLEAQLHETLAGFERTPALADAIGKSFTKRSKVFDVTTTTDRARYVDARKTDKLTPAAAADGFDYVLVMDSEFVGLWMAGVYTTTDELTPAQTIRYRMFRVREPSGVVLRNLVTGYGLGREHYKQAVLDRDFYTRHWPQVCASIADFITGDLNRNDKLHFMAASVGRGDEAPAIGTLLKKYEKTFRWDLTPAHGWRETTLDTKYARVLEPNDSSNKVIGVRFEVDLLAPELGQDRSSLEEYVPIAAQRRAEMYPDLSPLEKFDGITAHGFDKYLQRGPNGAGYVLLFRKLDELHMQVVNVVFLRDFDKLFPPNRRKIELMIATGKIPLRD
ncbi:MAG: hypothetical protein WDO72_07750 [Pseudomonadota bacterium]